MMERSRSNPPMQIRENQAAGITTDLLTFPLALVGR